MRRISSTPKCTHRVFVIAEVGITSVKPIEWDDEPFDNLVLDGNQKKLVNALVEAHYATNSTTNDMISTRAYDFVQGKGQGLIINLFGNPGVGKTFTVEAISERECVNFCKHAIS